MSFQMNHVQISPVSAFFKPKKSKTKQNRNNNLALQKNKIDRNADRGFFMKMTTTKMVRLLESVSGSCNS